MRILLSVIAFLFLGLAVPAGGADANPGTGAPRVISFGDLSFAVMPPKQVEPEGASVKQPAYGDQIPERVRALDGQRISLRGFMMPTRLEGDGVREFIIVTSPMVCCYGATPEVYEFILVKMTGDPAPMRENMPAHFEGVLRVGDIYEQGYWAGLFALECDRVRDE